MKEKIIAKRYAQAYAAYAGNVLGIKKAVSEFKALRSVMQDNPEVMDFFDNPGITEDEKCQFIDTVFGRLFSEELCIFLKLLVDKARIGLLGEIHDFIRVNYAHGQALQAVLETAYPLDHELILRIEKKLEEKTGRRLHFYLNIDGSLLGGVRVVVGNTVIDGTLKKRLEDILGSIEEAKVA